MPEQYKQETPGIRLRPERLRRRLLRRRLQRRLQDHRHQPAQRRGGAAREGHAAPAAQERDARQVRQDPGADRRRADRRGSARARHLRRLLRQHHVPRGGSRARHQEHASTARARCARRCRSTPRARGGQGRRARALHGDAALRHRASSATASSRTTTSRSWPASSARSASAPRSAHGGPTWCASTSSRRWAPSPATRRRGTYRVDFDKMQEAMNALSERILRSRATATTRRLGDFIEHYGREDADPALGPRPPGDRRDPRGHRLRAGDGGPRAVVVARRRSWLARRSPSP